MNKISKKIMLATAVLLMLSLVLTACTEINVSVPSSESSSSSESQSSQSTDPEPTKEADPTEEPTPTENPDPQPYPESNLTAEEYINAVLGTWESAEQETSYSFGSNGAYATTTPESTTYGYYYYEDDSLGLYSTGGEYVTTALLDFSSGSPVLNVYETHGTYIWIGSYDTLSFSDVGINTEWLHVDGEMIYNFYSDGTYQFQDHMMVYTGTYYYETSTGIIYLYEDISETAYTGYVEVFGTTVFLRLDHLDGFFYTY